MTVQLKLWFLLRVGLFIKVNIQKTKIMAPSLITSWQIDGEKAKTVIHYFLGFQNHWRQ